VRLGARHDVRVGEHPGAGLEHAVAELHGEHVDVRALGDLTGLLVAVGVGATAAEDAVDRAAAGEGERDGDSRTGEHECATGARLHHGFPLQSVTRGMLNIPAANTL
jgi:hypothetical protein